MSTYIISLGSNIDPQRNIKKAISKLKSEFSFMCQSDFIVTSPEGYTDQDDFLNGCIKIQSDLTKEELKLHLLEIESSLHRIRTENKNGPRTIDLDISAVDGKIVDSDYEKYWFVKQSVDQIL